MKVYQSLVALVLALESCSAYNAWGYTNQSDLAYYGQVPPVYPTPVRNGSSNSQWAAAYAKAYSLITQMTLDEKVNITRGFTGTCVGNSGSVPRLGINPLCLADAPDGIRGQEFVSSFPAGIHVAATFDRDLMYQYGAALGAEYRGKGINIALGPVAGPLGRVATGGRNWEGLSVDPYLAGAGMGRITKGIQDQGVIATPKHFLLNEQEWRRRPSLDLGEAVSSNADDRTIHELYAFPFMDAVKAGAASVMSSYQRINNSYASQNSKLLNGILKTELGFEGFVVSDWDGQYTGVASANAGLDLVMPDAGFWGGNLTTAVRNGSVSETRLNDMVARQLAAFYLLGQDRSYPPPSIYSSTQKHLAVNVQGNHKSLIADIGAAGTILVKNVNNTLPLRNPQFLNIYGYDAQTSPAPWSNPSRYGGGYEVNFGWKTFNGTLVTGGGSGSSTPPYVISPFQAIQERIISQSPPGTLRWDFYSENPNPAYVNADACLVFINAYASESFDRITLTDVFSDNLVNNVAANCSNTIVVLHSTGIRLVEAWIDNPNVTAVLFAGVPGQESGHSLTSVLWGDVSPSGRLPYTVAKKQSDYGSTGVVNGSVSLDAFPQSNFSEGLFIDYRHFDQQRIEPRFEFGFGLSYSNFNYGTISFGNLGGNLDQYPDSKVPIVQGGHPWLWEVLYNISISVTNTGKVDAHEVPQFYVTVPEPGTPVRQLRGFERVLLKAGETQTVTIPLTRRDLSVWDIVAQQWKLNRGAYEVVVGSSSRNIKANTTIVVA